MIVPSGFNVNPAGTLTGVKATSAGVKITPFKVSLSSTLGVVPPGALAIEAGVSSIASIGAGVTTTVAVVVSQFVGFKFSQI